MSRTPAIGTAPSVAGRVDPFLAQPASSSRGRSLGRIIPAEVGAMRSPPSPEGQPRRLHTPRRARQEVVETAEPLTDGDTPSPVKAANGSAGDAGVTDGQQPQAAKT